MAHVVRMSNASEQKRWLFSKSKHKYARDHWKKLGRDIGYDEL